MQHPLLCGTNRLVVNKTSSKPDLGIICKLGILFLRLIFEYHHNFGRLFLFIQELGIAQPGNDSLSRRWGSSWLLAGEATCGASSSGRAAHGRWDLAATVGGGRAGSIVASAGRHFFFQIVDFGEN